MSVAAAEKDLRQLLRSSARDFSSSSPFRASGTRMLQHFQTVTSVTLGSCDVQEVMHSCILQTAWQQPCLMHIILAITSAHLKRLIARCNEPQRWQRLAFAEATHWQNALQLYRSVLESPASVGFHNGDTLVGTTFLAVIYAFAIDDEIPEDHYSVAYEDAMNHTLAPMAAAAGILPLKSVFRVFDTSTAWETVVRNGNDGEDEYSSGNTGIDGIPKAFVKLCGLNTSSTAWNNKYYTILRHLVPLLHLELSIKHFERLIAFGARTHSAFRPLLEGRDAKALLLLSYWFALLRHLNQWWLTDRVKSECLAITSYLAKTADAEVQALLLYPASFGEIDLSNL